MNNYYVIKMIIEGNPVTPLYYMASVQSHITHDRSVALACRDHAQANFEGDGLLTGLNVTYEVVEINI